MPVKPPARLRPPKENAVPAPRPMSKLLPIMPGAF